MSERLRPFGNGFPQSWAIRSAFPAWGPVILTVTAGSDLDAADESVLVDLNGVPVGRLFETGGARCGTSVDTLIIDPVTFNDSVANGDAVFRFVATSSVNKEECPESWIEAGVSYETAVDCDASGAIDHCQIDAAGGLDLNHDGVLDVCEPDCNGNGRPDDYDVETGSSPDCNANGLPDECDVSGGASADCDGSGVPDECQPDCNANGVADPCDIVGGVSLDCDGSDIPDECELAAAGSSCPFPLRLTQNATGADASRFLGPPDDVGWGLGGQSVTYEWSCGRIVDGPGADITVYEVDSGEVEFAAVGVLVSDDGVDFQDVTASMVAAVRIGGDGAHGGITFRRSYDLARAGVRRARFVKLDGAGTGGAGSIAGFDLDAVGALHLVDRDCDESGALDSCEALTDCDADGLPDVCQVAALDGGDCTANAVPDACDIAGGATDCDADGVPDACEPDCNGNGAADACDIAGATSPDCNGNARPDACDLAVVAVAEQSRPLAPIGSGYAQSLTLLSPPAATGTVTVTVTARGDFDATNESLAVSLNGTSLGSVFDTASTFCSEISDSVALTASAYNALVLSGDAVLTVTATSAVGAFECEGSSVTIAVDYAAQPDCDGNTLPDACDVAGGTASDCNRNGVLDECDIAGGTSGDCNSDDRPDECPLCPTVQVVFVMDTSTSMTDEGAALCASISAVADELESELVDAATELLGIMAPGTGQFACLTGSVANLYGTSVPGDPPPNNEILGACPGGNEVGSEDWGRATSVVAGHKPWPAESVRLVIPISDEGPWCGDPATDPGVDRDSIKHAIQTSVASGVVVSPITGTGTSAVMRAMAQDLAHATGGEVFSSQLPEDDLLAGILGIIRSACRRSTDCNLNDRPDECDLADGTSQDCDADQRPDECEPDCNGNSRNDSCDIQEGTSQDGNGNGVPDECEGIHLRLGATDLAWTEAYAAIGYDVVRGSLLALRNTQGDFTAAVDGCVVNDTTATSWPQGADPAAGAGTWYLVRAELGTGPLTYDAPGGGQVGSRDAEIEASPIACP